MHPSGLIDPFVDHAQAILPKSKALDNRTLRSGGWKPGAIIIIAASNYTKCTLQRDCFETHTVPSVARECKKGNIPSPSLARYIIQYRCVTALQTRNFEELRKYDTT